MSTSPPTVPPGPIDPLLGQTLVGRYQLIRRVGEGGMGMVYEATQEALSRSVAVKVLRDKYADRSEVARRLVQEAKLASSIEHEHIVRIFDSGVTPDGRPFIVMEHLRGESLADRIRREGALPESLVLAIAEQAASALSAAHARAIVHRDIKPENVFLVDQGSDDRPSVKIVDFGISKSMSNDGADSSLRLTATGMVMGTPLYMSPEQARGDDELDERVDVWALGVILYEALTGEVPFRANNYLGVIAQVLSAELIPPRQLRPELSISAGMEQIVLHAMARDRTQRYASMTKMAADLERVRSGHSLEARAARVEPRPRALWPIGALLGTLTLAVITAPYWGHHETQPTIVLSPNDTDRVDASPTTASLKVTSEPPGANILVAGKSLGATPKEVQLPRGATEVTLSFPGYEDARASVDVGQANELNLALQPRRVELAQKPRPTHPTVKPDASKSIDKRVGTPGEETLPNPY
ncbi:MAG: serine/threonine-protein kinase [Polyangia bacterium]